MDTVTRREAYILRCQNNLRQLYNSAMQYQDRKGNRSFPYNPEGSIAALQEMIDLDAEGLMAGMFVCPEGEETPADREPGGRGFRLSEETCSYEMVPKKIRVTDQKSVLMYDKAPRHGGGRNVLLADGTVRWVEEPEFQQLLEKTLGAKPPAKQ